MSRQMATTSTMPTLGASLDLFKFMLMNQLHNAKRVSPMRQNEDVGCTVVEHMTTRNISFR